MIRRMFDETRRPVSAPGLEVDEADDGLVIFVEATDVVHHLNRTAGVIFGLCDGTRDAAAIAAEVAVLFSLAEPPLAETLTCLEELASGELIG
jgi:hypothetical protein